LYIPIVSPTAACKEHLTNIVKNMENVPMTLSELGLFPYVRESSGLA